MEAMAKIALLFIFFLVFAWQAYAEDSGNQNVSYKYVAESLLGVLVLVLSVLFRKSIKTESDARETLAKQVDKDFKTQKEARESEDKARKELAKAEKEFLEFQFKALNESIQKMGDSSEKSNESLRKTNEELARLTENLDRLIDDYKRQNKIVGQIPEMRIDINKLKEEIIAIKKEAS